MSYSEKDIGPFIEQFSPQGLQLVTQNWSQMRSSLSVDSSIEVDSKVSNKADMSVCDDLDARISALESATPAGEAFPVGSIFVSAVATDPATLLGYGTWSAIGAGRVLVGQDSGDSDFDTLLETGGAKTVTLTEAQIPSHTHVQQRHSATTGPLTGPTTAPDTSSNTPASWGVSTQATGGGQAHTNVQPYLVVKFWQRTA